jgi:signal transduction histidine kinase
MELTVLPPYYATWWFRIMILLLISGIAFSVFRFFERRKYERKLAVIMQEQAILEERNRISADMHDDLGSELTNIIILSRIATSQLGLNGDKAVPIQKIDAAATGVISKMNEIIWALNPANDSLEGLANYLQRFVNDFLDLHDLGGRMTRPENLPDIPLKSAFRRNVFLIVKEFMQNINKHAQATRVELHMSVGLTELSIEITDDGVGFDQEKLPGDGNGLRNMIKRAEDVGGTATIKSSPGKGSSINLVVPLRKDHAFA